MVWRIWCHEKGVNWKGIDANWPLRSFLGWRFCLGLAFAAPADFNPVPTFTRIGIEQMGYLQRADEKLN